MRGLRFLTRGIEVRPAANLGEKEPDLVKRIVICLDGTSNEPETGSTNAVRAFEIAAKTTDQIVYYDPGVGTMGARSATTRLGKAVTRMTGLALGHGVKDNVEEAYRFLMHEYAAGDHIYLFGFSRGAYTARALAGMLRTVGLLRPEAENLIPYAMKLYARAGRGDADEQANDEFWRLRTNFNESFGNPEFPNRFAPQIHFLGIWDTVKFVGWLNWRAQLQQARWPFTRNVANVVHGRHALALDEKRRYYGAYRFDPDEVRKERRDLREVWFTGVHSDVGGTYPDDHRLADIALHWMLEEARALDLEVDAKAYRKHLGIEPGEPLPEDYALGRVHPNGWPWFLLGAGWRRRRLLEDDEIHPSVETRRRLLES
ncbi:MAG: DUF2235 domain-containing protein [Dehalococcoidia bacterium]